MVSSVLVYSGELCNHHLLVVTSATAVLCLEALEVGLVLDDLDERHFKELGKEFLGRGEKKSGHVLTPAATLTLIATLTLA